jgi:iron-sulfur cluster repair protein YtfE (RIC family)
MDCLQLLKEQHDEAKELFKKFEKAEGSEADSLWQELKTKLQLHEQLEESQFYPELKRDERAHEIVMESYQEHHVMDVLIEELSGLNTSDEVFQAKLTVLQENTEHHMEEEESELFPKVRRIWNKQKREEVGDAMAREEQRRGGSKRAA